MLSQNRVEARFKIFFSFTAKFVPLQGQRAFDRLYPAEQLLDVLARPRGIFPALCFDGHPLSESLLNRVVRAVKRVCSGARRQYPRMACKEMLETEVNTELPFARCGAVVI